MSDDDKSKQINEMHNIAMEYVYCMIKSYMIFNLVPSKVSIFVFCNPNSSLKEFPIHTVKFF